MKEFVLREVRAYVFCFGNLEERNKKFRHKAAPPPNIQNSSQILNFSALKSGNFHF